MPLRLGALLASGILLGALTGQITPTTPLNTTPQTPSIQAPTDYPLGPGDQISVHVLDLDEIPDRAIRIDAHGDLSLPLAGELHAEGLTARQLQDQIANRLTGILKNPVVTVNLVDFRDQPVTILGAVNAPGVKQIRGNKTLLEAISDAGGLRSDAGAIITITRLQSAGLIPLATAKIGSDPAYSVAEVEIRSLLRAQNPGENIQLRSHDVVSVPPAEMIYILGEVSRPGGYEVKSSRTISILDAVALAGGINPNASSSHAKVLRILPGKSDPMEFVVDLNHMLAGKETNFQLQPADILYIPTNKGKVVTTRAIEALIGTGGSIAVFRGSR